MDQKYLAYGSLKNELTLMPQLLQVVKMYVHYRNELTLTDQHLHHHVIRIIMEYLQQELLLVHQLQLQVYNQLIPM